MGLRNNIKEFNLKLESYFINDDTVEWIKVSLEAATRVDIKIVSDKIKNKKEAEEFIKKCFKDLNEKNKDIELSLGFLELYTVDEAEIFEVEKPIHIRNNMSTFSDIIENLTEKLNSESENKARVISFYSYKGGVGRTVSLIQSAYNLAKKGKKVVLIDLDIEAPSFNSIFKNDIKSSNGLVKYLFNKYSKNREEISEIEDISSVVTKLNINCKGEIYVIPCGKIDLQYVNSLQIIKEKIIYENNYIRELINKVIEKYSVDYVFIDSRTGINNWGAIAIADISDEVFLIAYPNYENYEGIKLILDLVNDSKKCTVVFSRIDTSVGGIQIAKDLFNKLDIKQDFIGIHYDPKIAVSERYPIEDINSFDKLSDFILETEQLENNKKWIKNNSEEVKSILDIISNKYNFNDIITNNEYKVSEQSNAIVIIDKYTNIKRIINNIDKDAKVVEFNQKYIDVISQLLEKDKKNNNLYIQEILISSFIAFIENIIKNIECDQKEIYFECDNIVESSKSKNAEIVKIAFNKLNQMEKINDKTIYFLINFERIFEAIKNESIFLEMGDVLRLVDLATKILSLKPFIKSKVLVDVEFYNDNYKIFNEVNADLMELSWKGKVNVERLESNIEEILMLTEENVIGKNIKEEGILGKEIVRLLINSEYNRANENLLYCKRVEYNKYSQKLSRYISDAIKDRDELSKDYVLDIIKRAADKELENININDDKYSIISFNSFKDILK